MGNNVIYLADVAVPSYRRTRALIQRAVRSATPSDSGWIEAARRRATQKRMREIASPVEKVAQRPMLSEGSDAAALDSAGLSRAEMPNARAIVDQAVEQNHPASPTLRVTHLPDAWRPTGTSGRLRISGRLIDVCAELDRLAAAEAQAALPRRA